MTAGLPLNWFGFYFYGGDMKKIIATIIILFFGCIFNIPLSLASEQQIKDEQAVIEQRAFYLNNQGQAVFNSIDVETAKTKIHKFINESHSVVDEMTLSATTWFSKNPMDLEVLKGTKWVFTYTIYTTTFTDTITLGSNVITTSSGTVGLSCSNQYGKTGGVFYCSLIQGGIGFAIVIDGSSLQSFYNFTLNGNVATGIYQFQYNSTGTYSNQYNLFGQKISGPIQSYSWYQDYDGDGYGNPNQSMSASSQPYGYVSNKTDCNDYDSNVHPGATEIAGDGIDQDCNGSDLAVSKTWYQDYDGDGYGNPNKSKSTSFIIYGYVSDNTDCDDNDASVHPGATEIAGDGIDQDCNGSDLAVSKTWYQDYDGDGYGNPNKSKSTSFIIYGYVSDNTDCDDNDASVHPGATEIAGDGIDQDCNGSDEPSPSASNTITIESDLSFTLSEVIYKSLLGDISLWVDFKFFGEQSGKLLWELENSGTTTSAGNPITINSDLSFSFDATYNSLLGDIDLKVNFKFFGDQSGKLLWELDIL